MALILDEKIYAEELLKNKNYGKYLKLKDAVVLAKYYVYAGKDTREIKRLLRSLCEHLDKNWNEITQGWKIAVAIREAHKRRIRTAIQIPITYSELDAIEKVNNYALEKILFVFLVYGKFLKYNDTLIKSRKKARLLGTFYVNERLSNIFSVAHVEVRKKERNDIIHKLYEMGYLDATRYSGFVLKYVYENSPAKFFVDDYENIVLYYQREIGERVGECACGRLFLKKTGRDIQCHKCKQEIRRERWREEQKRHRSKKTNVSDSFM